MSGGTVNYQAIAPWLQGRGGNVFTQFGEDGLIAACLEQIGETNQQCFEIGAADGFFWSNTLRLRDEGWRAVLIESDPEQFRQLNERFGKFAHCIQETCTDLDATLSKTTLDLEPDLGVIDVDGQDWWLWHDLTKYSPRIMLVEISTAGPYQPIPDRGVASPAQAGLKAIEYLGISKGYSLVATTYCNALFVKQSCL